MDTLKGIVTEKADGFRLLAPSGKAFRVSSGDEVAVLGGSYGRSLEEDGYLIPTDPPEPEQEEGAASGDGGEGTSGDDDTLTDEEAIKALSEIEGVGGKTAEKLLQAGIRSVEDLINADTAELAVAIDVTSAKVTGWQGAAVKLLEEG